MKEYILIGVYVYDNQLIIQLRTRTREVVVYEAFLFLKLAFNVYGAR